MVLEVLSRCFYEDTALSHPSVSSGMPMSGTQPVFCHSLSLYFSSSPFPFAVLMPSPSTLTCHHACNSGRGIAALSTGGDVGWVSRQRGPHHLSSWEKTPKSHWLVAPVLTTPPPEAHSMSPQPWSRPPPSSLSFPLEGRGSPSKGSGAAILLCPPFPSSFIFTNIVLLLHENVKVLGARGGVFLVFISLPSIVFGTSGLNKYIRGHGSLPLSFQRSGETRPCEIRDRNPLGMCGRH